MSVTTYYKSGVRAAVFLMSVMRNFNEYWQDLMVVS